MLEKGHRNSATKAGIAYNNSFACKSKVHKLHQRYILKLVHHKFGKTIRCKMLKLCPEEFTFQTQLTQNYDNRPAVTMGMKMNTSHARLTWSLLFWFLYYIVVILSILGQLPHETDYAWGLFFLLLSESGFIGTFPGTKDKWDELAFFNTERRR